MDGHRPGCNGRDRMGSDGASEQSNSRRQSWKMIGEEQQRWMMNVSES